MSEKTKDELKKDVGGSITLDGDKGLYTTAEVALILQAKGISVSITDCNGQLDAWKEFIEKHYGTGPEGEAKFLTAAQKIEAGINKVPAGV